MHCRKNIRTLIERYQAASAADKPSTELIRFRDAIVALKSAPSQLPAPHAQASRYDDFVYVHQQSMAGHGGGDPGPHPGHRGPAFFPWHRAFLRQFELDLRAVSGDPTLCLPYWNFTRDQTSADPGYPFIEAFLGGDGTGPGDSVETGVFASANGWSLSLDDNGSNALQRTLGQLAASLPPLADEQAALAVTTYDSAPWNVNASGATSFRNLVEGWPSGPKMHNRVHVWVGGSMLPGTSPNDPVFFLNHAKEDQLWATWMQKHPTVPHYLPADSEPLPPGHTHLVRLSDHMESLAVYFGAATPDRPIDLLDHRAITWYDSDLPRVTLETPALAFSQTPAGLTVAQHLRFRIESCRPVFISLTGLPTGNFSVIGGPDFLVNPSEGSAFETLEIEVRFHAVGANLQVSAIDLEAHITDAEGYYAAAPGGDFVVDSFHVELVASEIVTSDSSVVLVLDRSGSMADVASDGFTKSELLRSAVGVLHALMQDDDEIGIARFDHEADVLLPMTPKSAGLGTTLTGSGLDPRGATSIGAGILIGHDLITGPGATKPNKAMLVLTDGNENTAPFIAGLPSGTIDQTTFAIGFGLPGQVSDPILDQISANTGGYLLVTGNMSSDAERFALAKAMVQILKDATLGDTIVDPQGQLFWNDKPTLIPFEVAETEVSIDVVVLCPVPFALDVQVITPAGVVLTSATPPNVRYVLGADVAYYRILLPALPSDPAGSHRGTWQASIRLHDPRELAELLRRKDNEIEDALRRLRALGRGPVPYNLTVHAYSNLTLDGAVQQRSYAPGDSMHLIASLREYAVPLQSAAEVVAQAVEPDGTRVTLRLHPSTAGSYEADFVPRRPGLYRFTFTARGTTSSHAPFQREQVRTASVWAGGNQPYDPRPSSGGDGCCVGLRCLLDQLMRSRKLRARAARAGLDLDAMRACLTPQAPERAPSKRGNASIDVASPALTRLARDVAAGELERSASRAPTPTVPVQRVARKEPTLGNLFVLPAKRDDEP